MESIDWPFALFIWTPQLEINIDVASLLEDFVWWWIGWGFSDVFGVRDVSQVLSCHKSSTSKTTAKNAYVLFSYLQTVKVYYIHS